MEMTQEQFDAAVKSAVEKGMEAKAAALKTEMQGEFEKSLADLNAKKANLRQEMQEAFEAAEQTREAKGYKAEAADIKFAKLVNLYANAKGDVGHMAKLAERMYPEDKEIGGYIKKTLEAGTPSAGGFGIPNILSSRVIDILYAQTVLDKIGVSKVPLVNGNMRFTRMDTAATVGWVGETPTGSPTEPVFGDVTLNAKKMFAFAEISNSLIKYNAVGIEGWLSRELQRRTKILLDYSAFYGSGTSYQPSGLNVLGVTAMGSSSTAMSAAIPDSIVSTVKQSNVPLTRGAWAMSPKMESWLKALQTSTGHWIFREEMDKYSKLCGFPYFVSTSISYTDTTTDYADIWFGDFDEFLWGSGRDLELQMSTEASFVSGGVTYSAFQRDSALVRVVAEHDFNVMHAAAFVHGIYSVS